MTRLTLAAALPLLLANTGVVADAPPAAEAPPAATAGNIPPMIRAMLDQAMAHGNEKEVATLAKYAEVAAPEHAAAIATLVDGWQSARTASAEQALRSADFLDLLKGRAELAASATSGNTHTMGLSATVDIKRESVKWRHKLHLQADFQRNDGVTSREHYLFGYEPNWKIDGRAYLYGAAQYESDHFLGFDDRYSLSAGAGYSAIRKGPFKLDLELGPAYRETVFTDQHGETNLGARGSLDFSWKLDRNLTFRQNASAYVQNVNSTVVSKSALAARLFGPFSAQLSYTLQYESQPPAGGKNTDTASRAALVVEF